MQCHVKNVINIKTVVTADITNSVRSWVPWEKLDGEQWKSALLQFSYLYASLNQIGFNMETECLKF